MLMAPITDEKFLALTEQMLTEGGEWGVSLSKDATTLRYRGETHAISLKQADVMFTCIPRRCAATA